jgi:AcrR family transcriptional regulator
MTAHVDKTAGQSRPDQIKAAAHRLFVKKGFAAASMNQVALAAGVSKRTPYIYFENKHDLFSAVVLSFLMDLEAKLRPVWRQEVGVQALKKAMKLYADYALQNPARFELIMTFERREYYPGSSEQPMQGHAEKCVIVNDRITSEFVSEIARAQSKGLLQKELTAGQLGLLIWSSLAGVLAIAIDRKDVLDMAYGWSAEQMIEAFIARSLSSHLTNAVN